MKRILVVEDEDSIRDFVVINLRRTGYDVTDVASGEEAVSEYGKQGGNFDIALLDIMMPGMDGFSLCRWIREQSSEIGIIMLSAKSQEMDKVNCLMIGADDYVTKPFRPLEVVARVKAQLRRYKKYSPTANVEKIQSELSYSKLRLNIQTHECLLDGEAVALTPTEFSILHVLLANAGNVVSIEDLFHAVWKDEYYSKNSSTITVHIRHLREKLKDSSDTPQYIKTIWGVGYKI